MRVYRVPSWLRFCERDPEECTIKAFTIPNHYIESINKGLVKFTKVFFEKEDMYHELHDSNGIENYQYFSNIRSAKNAAFSKIKKEIKRYNDIKKLIRKQRAYHYIEEKNPVTEIKYKSFCSEVEYEEFSFEDEESEEVFEEIKKVIELDF